MMNIHTTQNLISLENYQQPIAKLSQTRDFRINEDYLQGRAKRSRVSVTFEGKMPEIVNKVAKDVKKKGIISRAIEKKWFRTMLDFMDQEVLVQAIISAMVCMVLRPLTIMGLSTFNEKSRKDNAYASAHSFASGAAGIAASILISYGFAKGVHKASFSKLANKMIEKNKDIEGLKKMLKEMRPDIDIKTVYNEATGKVNDEKLWRTIDGKKIASNMKDVMTVARPTHYSECSKDTFKDFGVDIDLDGQKGKNLFNMVTTDGKKVIEQLKAKDMFIAVKEDGMGGSHKGFEDTNFFSLKYINKDFMKQLDPSINTASMERDGKRLHPSEWLKTDGSKWLDEKNAENIHLPSFRETTETTPVYTGERRPGDDRKYASYLANIENYKLGDVPDELGTVITKEYLNADKHVETKKRILTWLPDLITRPLVAAGTIALIPWVLKNLFGIEKKSKAQEKDTKDSSTNNQESKQEDKKEVSFKGGLGDRIGEKIGDIYANWYANSMLYNKKWVTSLADKVNRLKGDSAAHVSALGSIITSGTYMYKTYTNDKLEKDNRNTLVLNQLACCAIPTVAAYTVNKYIRKNVKNVEFAFSGAMKGLVQEGKFTDKEYEEFAKKLPKRLKAVNTLATLATFTLIYRYGTPVIVTPMANWVSGKWREHKAKKRQMLQEKQMEAQNNLKEQGVKAGEKA